MSSDPSARFPCPRMRQAFEWTASLLPKVPGGLAVAKFVTIGLGSLRRARSLIGGAPPCCNGCMVFSSCGGGGGGVGGGGGGGGAVTPPSSLTPVAARCASEGMRWSGGPTGAAPPSVPSCLSVVSGCGSAGCCRVAGRSSSVSPDGSRARLRASAAISRAATAATPAPATGTSESATAAAPFPPPLRTWFVLAASSCSTCASKVASRASPL
mmetsp:Transcript_9520/g.22439  ORF Transcript_9520/g.22439 Transcript_9520/m.22439 type:complete len:212 (+) Transcript_9520:530-1165(+)